MNGILWIRQTDVDPALWSQPVGGVALLKRQARLLRAAGVTRLVVVGAAGSESAMASIQTGRLAVVADIHPIITDGTDLSGISAALLPDVPTLILDASDLYERGALKRAVDHGADSDQWFSARGLAVVGTAHTTAALTAFAAGEHGPTPLPERDDDYVGAITDSASHTVVQHTLWERCRKVADGVVSRNLNRHISLFISKRIAHTGISPNQISTVTLILGLVGAFLASHGTYWMVLGGAVLLKANSVLDGVDGELARMRIQSSVLGEWLDTVSDDLSNQSFFLGVGIGTAYVTGDPMWLWLTVAAAVPLFLTSALYYYWLIKMGRGDLLVFSWFRTEARTAHELAQRGIKERVIDIISPLFRRDAFVMLLLVMSVFGVVQYSLFFVAPAALGTFIAILLRTIQGNVVTPSTDGEAA
ncbi:MAG: phosphatidylglycerophosphate synthase [Myxococcota bacterium]